VKARGFRSLAAALADKLVEHGVAASRGHAERLILVLGLGETLEVVERLEKAGDAERLYREEGIPHTLPGPLELARMRGER